MVFPTSAMLEIATPLVLFARPMVSSIRNAKKTIAAGKFYSLDGFSSIFLLRKPTSE
jgi:hypothetical protein